MQVEVEVVVDNGMVQVSLSTPQGHITAGHDQNLLQYNATQANSGGYVCMHALRLINKLIPMFSCRFACFSYKSNYMASFGRICTKIRYQDV
jgi:hypothetical protein